jgi:hypothetical protein
MLSALLVCAVCVAVEPPARLDAESRGSSGSVAAYNAAKATAGCDAAAQVRLALWCEANGLQTERLKHLAIAILKDPGNATARGLLGLVSFAGRWQLPEDVSAKLKADEARSAALAEYNARRAQSADSAAAHWKMALWCEKHGLKPEAIVHLTRVTQLQPGYEAAWKRLGYKKRRTRWASDEQIAAEQAEAKVQKDADTFWTARFAPWRRMAADPSMRSELNRALADVTDPRAVPAIWSTFARGAPEQQTVALDLLGQIDSANATRAMALLAVRTKSKEVRTSVIQQLKRRDFRDVASFLVTLLRDRILDPDFASDPILYRFQLQPIGADGFGSQGILLVKGPRYSVVRSYSVDETYGERSVSQLVTDPRSYDDRVQIQRRQQLMDLGILIDQILGESQVDLALVGERDRHVDRVNDRIIETLSQATNLELGKDPEAWRKWWIEEQGYAYVSPTPKPTVDLTIVVDTPTINLGDFHYSCFAAGTPVHTMTGQRPIETIAIGDRVLTQNPRSGALSFQPVLAAVHNRPDALWKIDLGRETIQATGIHRFWHVGKGWVMTRDLKPGDRLRALGGVAEVKSAELGSVQPVFNLEVLQAESYFVGKTGMLVHDNSPVQRVSRPFDAVSERAPVAEATR